MNQPWIYMCSPFQSPLPPPSPSHPSGSSHCTSPEHLSCASNLGWWSVSPLIVYLFQCCSLRSSHPRLLPQSPKVCSVHLCLFFCFAYWVIVTIFLKFKKKKKNSPGIIKTLLWQALKRFFGFCFSLMWTIFKVLNLFQYCFCCFMFWFSGHGACRILTSHSGWNQHPQHWKVKS